MHPTTALIAPFNDFKTVFGNLFFGIGWNTNLQLIKITGNNQNYDLHYNCSNKLKNIINNELEYNYIKNAYIIQKIFILIFFIIITKMYIVKYI